jgi:hypothetical protein
MASPTGYDAFISYSHRHDGRIAPALEIALERFAKPWYKMRALRVFRDTTNLGANPSLWGSIQQALEASEWFVLLASAESAASEWVNREVLWWRANRSPDRILIAATSDGLAWDSSKGDWADSAPLPPALRGLFADEPLWLDLTTVQVPERKRGKLADELVASVAAPILGRPKDQLISEQWRQHRRTMRLARGAVAVLATLTAVSVVATFIAVGQRNDARTQTRVAQAGELAALAVANLSTNLGNAQLLAVEATRLDDDAQTRAALFQAATASPSLERYLPVGSQVSALGTSSDGKVIVAGTTDGHLVRFDLATGGRTDVRAASSPISDVATGANGATVAAIDGSQTIVWHAGTGQQPKGFSVQGAPSKVAISPSGQLVATLITTSTSAAVVLRNAGTGRTMRASAGAGDSGLAFPSEASVIMTNIDGTFEELASSDLHMISHSTELKTPANGFGAGISPNGAYAGYAKLGEVVAWKTANAAQPGVLQQITGAAPSLEPSYLTINDNGTQAATIQNGIVAVSSLSSTSTSPGTKPIELTANDDSSRVSFLGTGDQLVSASGDQLALWNLRHSVDLGLPTGITLPGFQTVSGPAGLAMSPDGRYLAIANHNPAPGSSEAEALNPTETVSAYRIGHTLTRIGAWQRPGVPVWSGDQLLLVATSAAGSQVQVTTASGHTVASWPATSTSSGKWLYQDFVNGNQLVLLWSHGVRRFDLQTKTSTFTPVQLPNAPFHGFASIAEEVGPLPATSPDGTDVVLLTAATGAGANQQGGNVVVVNLQTGASHAVGSGPASDAVFTQDRLLVQRTSGVLEEWDTTGQHLLLSVPGRGDNEQPLVATSDGSMAARLDNGGVASLTDLASGQVVANLNLPAPGDAGSNDPWGITTMIFAPNQQYLFTATPGGVLTRWDIAEADLVKLACERAGQSLTPAVWAEYVHTPPPGSLACPGAGQVSLAELPVTAATPSPPASLSPAASPTAPASPATSPSSPASPGAPAQGPAATVEAYFSAINAHNYRRAWDLGGKNLRETYAAFAAGFKGTSHDEFTVSTVHGRTVTGSLIATQSNGTKKDYVGDFTVTGKVITHFKVEVFG